MKKQQKNKANKTEQQQQRQQKGKKTNTWILSSSLNLNVSIKKWIASKGLFCSLLKANKQAHFKEAIAGLVVLILKAHFLKRKKNGVKR